MWEVERCKLSRLAERIAAFRDCPSFTAFESECFDIWGFVGDFKAPCNKVRATCGDYIVVVQLLYPLLQDAQATIRYLGDKT